MTRCRVEQDELDYDNSSNDFTVDSDHYDDEDMIKLVASRELQQEIQNWINGE